MNLISIGASGASRSAIFLAERIKKDQLKGFLDNRIVSDLDNHLKFLGTFADCLEYKKIGCKFITGIGSDKSFKNKETKLKDLGLLPTDFETLVSDNCFIENSINKLGDGIILFDHSFIGYDVSIGDLTIIGAKAYLGHETEVGSYSIIGPKVTISGNVKIEKNVYIGAGTVIRDHVAIVSGTLIGCGSVVTKDIIEPGIYFGNPATLLKKFNK